MPGGRPPKPRHLHVLEGTLRPDRHGDAADAPDPAPLRTLPPAPGFFDEMAAFEWNRVGPELVAKELLTEFDLAAFTLYCLNVSRVVACEKILKAKGMTLATPQGFEQARPEVSIARQCGAEVRKFAQEFGLTPSSRGRVRTPQKPDARKPANPWEKVG